MFKCFGKGRIGVFSEGVLDRKKKIICWLVDYVKAYHSKLMELPDSPKKIARGVALGLSFDFLPIPIISIPLSYLVARLTRCNPVAAVATVVFFKLAVPFFFTLNILTGNAILGDMHPPDISIAGDNVLYAYLSKMLSLGYPFLVGSLVNGTAVWVAVYFLLCFLLEKRRRRRGV